MPCLRPTLSRHSCPEGFGSPGSRALSDTPRRTSLSLKTSRTALARSSLLARISTVSPDQEIPAPTPRKSNRVLISLAAWFSALSTSCLSTLLTMSKNDSATPRSSRVLVPHRSPGASRIPPGAGTGGHASRSCDGHAWCSLSFTVPSDVAARGRLPEWPKGAVCKTVGLAYDGSNPSPATTSENGPWAGASPPSRAVVPWVILCHRRSEGVAAPRWLRTYSGRNRGRRSGSPNRLLCGTAGHSACLSGGLPRWRPYVAFVLDHG